MPAGFALLIPVPGEPDNRGVQESTEGSLDASHAVSPSCIRAQTHRRDLPPSDFGRRWQLGKHVLPQRLQPGVALRQHRVVHRIGCLQGMPALLRAFATPSFWGRRRPVAQLTAAGLPLQRRSRHLVQLQTGRPSLSLRSAVSTMSSVVGRLEARLTCHERVFGTHGPVWARWLVTLNTILDLARKNDKALAARSQSYDFVFGILFISPMFQETLS
jgi:hypothetical protein